MAYINIWIKCNFEDWHIELILYTKKVYQIEQIYRIVAKQNDKYIGHQIYCNFE